MTRDAVRPRRRPGSLSELLSLAGPVMLARLGIMAMGLTDTIVVGRFSATQLGFLALGWAPTAVMLTTSVGLLSGVQVMTARAIGEGRADKVGAVLRRGVGYALLIGLGAALLLFIGAPPFLRAIGLDPALAAGAGVVVRIFALSLPLDIASRAASGFLEGLARPVPAMVAMWTANLVNLGLDLLLVPGGFGLPAMGAAGSAWSTAAARLTLVVLLAVYIARMKGAQELRLFHRHAPAPADAREQRRIGYGAGASLFAEGAAFSGMNIVAGWLGGLAVAGWSIVLNLSALVFMAPLGLSAATSVLVARAYGARDRDGVVRACLMGFGVCTAVAAACALVVWPAAPLIARAYATDPALVAIATHAIALASLFFVADALQVVAAQALRAQGDVLVPTIIHVTCYALVMLPLGWVLAHPAGLGLGGILWAVIAASMVAAGLLLSRFRTLSRRPL
jgi:MATE family multidrug resistance protein